jgi:ubiquitin-protein ligase
MDEYFLLMYYLMLLHLEFQLIFQVDSNNYISFLLFVKLFLKDDYPANPPKFKLLNKIYHPNITNDGDF